MTEAMGPVFAAGFQHIVDGNYGILYLPDVNNNALQRANQPPTYWWLPNSISLAKDTEGHYKFSFTHFQGVPSGGTPEKDGETTGALVGFSTTMAPPLDILSKSEEELVKRLTSPELKGDYFWGMGENARPNFRPVPIVSNQTTITNLKPNDDRTVTVIQPGEPTKGVLGAAPLIRNVASPDSVASPRSVPLSSVRGSNLDPWYVNLKGQGPGAVNAFAENAYSGLLGSLPAALVWDSFHGGTSAIAVWHNMRIKVWSPAITLTIRGNWKSIQSHYSAQAKFQSPFFAADAQAAFNDLRKSGVIEVSIKVDNTIPSPSMEKIQEAMEKRSDLVYNKFSELAQKVIFDAVPFKEEPAAASTGTRGFLGWGGGVAFKMRRDTAEVDLNYSEERQYAYLQEYPISSQLQGLYDVIKADPTGAEEKRYFRNLYLNEWEKKVARIFTVVYNRPNPALKWSGDPVKQLTAQVGYPNTSGVLQWDGHGFDAKDANDAHWEIAQPMKPLADVQNPPAGWSPDKTWVKRTIMFNEPPSELDDPFVRIAIEKNNVDLDPGDTGRLVNDIHLDVRVDNVGILEVGPIDLAAILTDASQVVEVTFQAEGNRDDGKPRPPAKFRWTFEDQKQSRYWKIFTGDPEFVPRYKYQVHVMIKGTIFEPGREWTGPWVEATANGPLMVQVPAPGGKGVTFRMHAPSTSTDTTVTAPPPMVTGFSTAR